MTDPRPVRWDAQGQAHSTRYADIYRSHGHDGQGGWAQARRVFLAGVGLLPADALPGPDSTISAWAGLPRWHVLENGFGLGLNFLATWHVWQQDPSRPAHLFYTATESDLVSADDLRTSVAAFEPLHALAEALAQQWQGLMPGVHRLVLGQGRVHLTLLVGEAERMLRELDVAADSLFLDGFSPSVNPAMWSEATLAALARRCRIGTRAASWCVAKVVQERLQALGFAVQRVPGLPPKRHALQATYAPRWTVKSSLRAAPSTGVTSSSASAPAPVSATVSPSGSPPVPSPSRGSPEPPPPCHAIVIGAGLAGAAAAYSLALRGWRVSVLDRADHVAAGASGLPVGLAVPHATADDSPLSVLTRAGVAATLQRLRDLAPALQEGRDWQCSGVLEHQVEGKHRLPKAPPEGYSAWSRQALDVERQAAHIPSEAQASWHARAAWVRPAALVQVQLAHPRIRLQLQASIERLERVTSEGGLIWRVSNAEGQILAQAPHLVLAAGYATLDLLGRIEALSSEGEGAAPVWPAIALPLNPLRGQVAYGDVNRLSPAARALLPSWPVNGFGSFIHGVPVAGLPSAWVMGSTFERQCPEALLRHEDHALNASKLQRLLPVLAEQMQTAFTQEGGVQAWAGLRATLPDRLPAVGPCRAEVPDLHVLTGLGARGISLSVLCGEILAAQCLAEPWPVPKSHVERLKATRFGVVRR